MRCHTALQDTRPRRAGQEATTSSITPLSKRTRGVCSAAQAWRLLVSNNWQMCTKLAPPSSGSVLRGVCEPGSHTCCALRLENNGFRPLTTICLHPAP